MTDAPERMPTPRTDAVLASEPLHGQYGGLRDLARQLERELAEAQQRVTTAETCSRLHCVRADQAEQRALSPEAGAGLVELLKDCRDWLDMWPTYWDSRAEVDELIAQIDALSTPPNVAQVSAAPPESEGREELVKRLSSDSEILEGFQQVRNGNWAYSILVDLIMTKAAGVERRPRNRETYSI